MSLIYWLVVMIEHFYAQLHRLFVKLDKMNRFPCSSASGIERNTNGSKLLSLTEELPKTFGRASNRY